MPTDRLLRYTMAGSTLLISLIFFYVLLGGDVHEVTRFFGGQEYIFKIIALALSTPFIGIMVSLIVFQALVFARGYKIYYYVPTNKSLIKWVLEEKTLTTETERFLRKMLGEDKIAGRRFAKNLYPFYQVKVRKHIKDDAFLERKWSVIWIHRNIIGALMISILLTILHSKINQSNLNFDWYNYKSLVLLFILAYVIFALVHIHYAVRTATDYEHKLLMNAYEDEIKKDAAQAIRNGSYYFNFWGLLKSFFSKG